MNTYNAPPKLSPGIPGLTNGRFAARGSWPRPSWASLALEIEPHFAEEAEQIRRKKISDSRRGEMVENVPPSQKSRDQAAAAVGVSGADPLEGADSFLPP